MPPQDLSTASHVLNEENTITKDKGEAQLIPPVATNGELKIVWRNVIFFVLLHAGGIYGAYLLLTKVMWVTFFFTKALVIFSGFGITVGAHRLWAHKSYKARLPLRVLLVILNTIAFQDSVIDWSRDHRLHHKYSETNADPHNATRGFFFAHVGWLLVRKHPEIKAKGQTIDMSDLWADPVLRFQKKYYLLLMPLACFVIPAYLPTLWGETLWNAFFVCAPYRYCYTLNATWLVNSAAHLWGHKPYDKTINPVETKAVSFVALGEGSHNYHHTFPWDYKTAELGSYTLNLSKLFIDIMASIGLAYDLKTVSTEIIKNKVKRTGDGSHPVWGWSDKDISEEDKKYTSVINPMQEIPSKKEE